MGWFNHGQHEDLSEGGSAEIIKPVWNTKNVIALF